MCECKSEHSTRDHELDTNWHFHKLLKTAERESQRERHLFLFQGAYAGFVYTYAVAPPMSLPPKTAGYLASLFWAAITAGRLVSIPLAYRFKPVRLLMVNLVRLPS